MELTMGKEKKVKKEEYKKEEAVVQNKPKRGHKRILSFDVYFQTLMRKDSKVQSHHKAPMRKYAEAKGLIEATEEEFDRIFRLY